MEPGREHGAGAPWSVESVEGGSGAGCSSPRAPEFEILRVASGATQELSRMFENN
jgi:hypothetical protein